MQPHPKEAQPKTLQFHSKNSSRSLALPNWWCFVCRGITCLFPSYVYFFGLPPTARHIEVTPCCSKGLQHSHVSGLLYCEDQLFSSEAVWVVLIFFLNNSELPSPPVFRMPLPTVPKSIKVFFDDCSMAWQIHLKSDLAHKSYKPIQRALGQFFWAYDSLCQEAPQRWVTHASTTNIARAAVPLSFSGSFVAQEISLKISIESIAA